VRVTRGRSWVRFSRFVRPRRRLSVNSVSGRRWPGSDCQRAGIIEEIMMVETRLSGCASAVNGNMRGLWIGFLGKRLLCVEQDGNFAVIFDGDGQVGSVVVVEVADCE
jgi:hypothetical protein